MRSKAELSASSQQGKLPIGIHNKHVIRIHTIDAPIRGFERATVPNSVPRHRWINVNSIVEIRCSR